MIRNFEQLLARAVEMGPKRVAVAAAHDEASLGAITEAQRRGLASGLLFGDRDRILKLLRDMGSNPDEFLAIIHVPSEAEAVHQAVTAVRKGEADILLKGKVRTSEFLRQVLDPNDGLRTGRLLSDAFLFEDRRREGNQLVIITDGGVNLSPTLEQKVDIILNAVEVAHCLGNDQPKVAVLSAVETVNPKLPSTVDAAVLTQMNRRGQIRGCIVEGPLALDNAVSPQAAGKKGLDSPVAGAADILLCPDIVSANLLAKGTTYFAGFPLAHVTVGAAVPVLIPSRADSAEAKMMSIALGVLVSEARETM